MIWNFLWVKPLELLMLLIEYIILTIVAVMYGLLVFIRSTATYLIAAGQKLTTLRQGLINNFVTKEETND